MKNLLNSPTDGNMPSPGNPIQPATRPVNNTTLYGSLSGPDDNTTTYKQPYRSSKGDCGCSGAKPMRQAIPSPLERVRERSPNPPNNAITYPPASRTQNLPQAYPSKMNNQTQNMANNSMSNPNK